MRTMSTARRLTILVVTTTMVFAACPCAIASPRPGPPSGTLNVATDSVSVAVPVDRLAGSYRWDTAIDIAREEFPGAAWGNIDDIVIACSDDRAAADPLAAAGLCWLYDAPLILCPSSNTPNSVKYAIVNMCNMYGNAVKIHVVGGPTSMPDARINDILVAVKNATSLDLAWERVGPYNNRYEVAYGIAKRMADEAVSRGKARPVACLVANGADPNKFFDALALSPICAQNGFPILLTTLTTVPTPTKNALSYIAPTYVFIGGGPKSVGPTVKSAVHASEQWYGDDRYATAVRIAERGDELDVIGRAYVAVASRLPDALAGGVLAGFNNGPILITRDRPLSVAPDSWLASHRPYLIQCWVLGGPASIPSETKARIQKLLE